MSNGSKPRSGTEEAFRRFWDLGYTRLLPVVPPSAGIHNAGKRPGLFDGNQWHGKGAQTFDATEADLTTWGAMGAGVGLRMGKGIVGLDIDSLSEEWSGKIERGAIKHLGPAPVRIGRWPKRLLMYRAPPDVPYMSVRFDDGVSEKRAICELLAGNHNWANVETIHPQTGKPYTWPGGIPHRDELTLVTLEQWEMFFERLRDALPLAKGSSATTPKDRASVDQQALRGDPELIKAAMAAIPNRHEHFDYFKWRDIATALRAALPDDQDLGEELFTEFSDRTDLRPEDIEENPGRIYRSMKAPFTLGAQLIYDHAEKLAGWQGHKVAYFDPEAAASQHPSLDELFDASAKAKRGPLALTSFNDAVATALTVTSKPLVEDLLDQGAMTVLYGESNTGKTFVAMDLAYHIASGRPWGGNQTTKGVVVYIAAEGGAGARKRAAALAAKYGPCDGFHFVLSPVDLLNPQADLTPLVELLRPIEGLVLIVIDTLSRVLAGGDENGSTDMGALVKHFDVLRAAASAHLMVIHHTGKNVAKGARGHSLLRAATDTEIEITEGQIRVTKQRDLDKCSAVGFGLETVVLGRDERGKDVTSCTVGLIARTGAEAGKPSAGEAAVLEVLRAWAASSANPIKGADLSTVTAALGDTASGAKERVRKYLESLVGKNCVVKVGRGAWTPRDVQLAAYFEEIDPPEEAPQKLGFLRLTEGPQKPNPEIPLSGDSGGIFG